METPSLEGLAVGFAKSDARTREQLAEHERRIEGLENRQDALEKMATSVEVLASRQETVEKNVNEIKASVKTLTERSAKRWDNLIDKIIWAVAAAALALLFPQIFS